MGNTRAFGILSLNKLHSAVTFIYRRAIIQITRSTTHEKITKLLPEFKNVPNEYRVIRLNDFFANLYLKAIEFVCRPRIAVALLGLILLISRVVTCGQVEWFSSFDAQPHCRGRLVVTLLKGHSRRVKSAFHMGGFTKSTGWLSFPFNVCLFSALFIILASEEQTLNVAAKPFHFLSFLG